MPSLRGGPTSRRGSHGQAEGLSQVALTSRSNRSMMSTPTLHVLPSEPSATGETMSRGSTLSRNKHRRIKESASSCIHGVERSLTSSNGFANASLLVWLLIGVALAVPVLLVLKSSTADVARQPVDSDCKSTVAGMTSLLKLPISQIKSYEWLFQTGFNMSQTAFGKFEESLLQQSALIPWVSYAPYVTNAQREAWEAATGHQIVQNEALGVQQPAWTKDSFAPAPRGTADSYFPLLFVSNDTPWLSGFDVLSDPAAQLVVFDAIHTGQLSIGPKMKMEVAGGGTQDVHRFVLPYFGLDGAPSIEGVFHGVLVARPLLEEVVTATTQNVSIGIRILDSSAGNAVIYSFPPDSVPDGRTVGYYAIPFADRQWIMHCWGHSKTIAAPWVTFAFIILFCIAAALLTRTCILRNQGRRRKKETNVINNPRMSERQVDWMRTNAFSILNAIRDPLLIIDREGYVIDGNDDALLLTKYRVEDLIFGIHISKMFPGIMGSTSKDKMKDKHPVKVSHPPGPWTSSCPLPNLDGSPGAGQKEGNVVIDVDSTYLDLQETGTARDPSINTQDDKLLPGMQEVTLKTKDGRDLLVEANFSPYIDCQDQKEKIQMVLFRDVSLWKSLIKDTVEAKELAEASRNEISDYLSFVCHELRSLSSLLTQSISALDSGLRSGIASPTSPSALSPLSPASSEAPVPQVHAAYQEAIEHLASISDSTRTMKNILNDTRVLSKVENRTVEFEKTNIDLRQLLQRIHRAQATYRDSWWMGSTESLKSSQVPEVEFKLVIKGLSDPSPMLDSEQKLVGLGMSDVSPDMPSKEWFPPIVKTDSARLTQVLTNIVTNAFEHTVKGSVTLRAIVENVRLYDPCNSPSATERRRQMKDSKPTKQVLIRFEVEDTGRGIAKAVMPKLFRMYSQNSVDRALGSTGLSLNVIYALLSLMGSELQAFSTVGQGTTVWFSLWFDLPDEYKLDEQESDAEFKGWSVGSQFITDVFLGRRESIYQPVGKKEKESYEKRISRHASSTSNAELQHSTSGDFCSGNTSASPSSDRRSPATIDAMVGRNSPEILRAHSTSPLGGESSRDLSRAATVSTKPSISRIHSGDGSLAHLTGGPSRANTLTADLRRGSQSGERKGKVARKTPNPAVRRLGTHPLRDRPIRVLVVEDNEVLLKIAGTTLARAGFEVKQAINGDQAIQRVVEMGEKYFDVVLMDLLMPVMDGFQATEEIRRRGWTMPVIALTAKTLESDRLRCFKIGFNYFMTKPFQLGDIATVIRFMVGAEAEQKAQAATDGASTNQPTYGGPWSKFT